jgi:hypothetical protein
MSKVFLSTSPGFGTGRGLIVVHPMPCVVTSYSGQVHGDHLLSTYHGDLGHSTSHRFHSMVTSYSAQVLKCN